MRTSNYGPDQEARAALRVVQRSLDVVEVTRCKNCIHWQPEVFHDQVPTMGSCTLEDDTGMDRTRPEHFCSDGEVKPPELRLFGALEASPYNWAWRITIDEEEPNVVLVDPKHPNPKAFHVAGSHAWERRKLALAKTFDDWMSGPEPINDGAYRVWS